jgi:hypothetical protein
MNGFPGLRRFPAWALLAPLLFWASPALSAERIAVRQVLDTSSLGSPFVYDVSPDGAVLVLTGDNLFDAGSGKNLFGEPLKDPAWFAFAGRNLRILVGGVLYAVDGGVPRRLLDVPMKSCVFVSDGERTFLAGVLPDGRPALFLHREGEGHKALLSPDAPIDAMALSQDTLYFSSGSRIFALKEGGPPRLVAHLPRFTHIPSVAADMGSGLLYFSDGDDLYALRGGDILLVREGLGGMLRVRGGDLYVLSWRGNALFRLSGIPAALSSSGALAPLQDPCGAPGMTLHCEAAKVRALLKVLSDLSGDPSVGTAASRAGLEEEAAKRKTELESIQARLGREAQGGSVGIRWGGGIERKAIRANDPVATGREGAGITLWDGSEVRIGPDTKASAGECAPSQECRMTLAEGLLHFETYRPPVQGLAAPAPEGFAVVTDALVLGFRSARIVVHAAGGRTVVAVLEGRVKAVTPRGETVIAAAGETLEAAKGEAPGAPGAADMKRLNPWWEKIR